MKSKLFVIFSFSLALGIVAYFLGDAFVRREAARPELEIRELPRSVNEGLVESEQVQEPVQVPLTEEARSASYELGYDRGYRAFMEQQGQVVPVTRVASYTSLSEVEMDSEQASKGYVDGYHKAGDSFYCPAGCR